jgi:tungstate transport system ATP-binding protein
MQKNVTPEVEALSTVKGSVLPIEAQKLRVERGGRTILDNVDFAIDADAAATILLGPNGAGKSVLIRCLAGLMQPDSGTLTWAGKVPDRARISRIGFVFQRPILLERSALANIDYALRVTNAPVSDRVAAALQALDGAGLAHLAEQPARSLSAGEQQRLALARAIACAPELLILDEPTANLDPASTAAFEQSLHGIRQRGTPIVLITHDLGQARRLGDRIVFMHQGCIVETTPAAQFFTKPQCPQAAAFVKGELVV